MKNQALFSSKDKSKKSKCRLLRFFFGALRVNMMNPDSSHLSLRSNIGTLNLVLSLKNQHNSPEIFFCYLCFLLSHQTACFFHLLLLHCFFHWLIFSCWVKLVTVLNNSFVTFILLF